VLLVVLLFVWLCSLQPCNAVTPPAGTILTTAQVAAVSADIVTAFSLSAGYGTPCNPCTLGDTLGGLIVLAFHDAIGGGGPTGNGGPNGCIDLNAADNAGLAAVMATYAPIQAKYNKSISIADIWVLGANLAIQYGSTLAPGVTLPNGMQTPPAPLVMPFRYGRQDQSVCTDSAADFPQPTFSFGQTLNMFGGLGLTSTEVVALLGAHSIGRCQTANSGFNGGWTPFQASFSNFFYYVLGHENWVKDNTLASWNGGQQTIMLQSDVELIFSPSASCPMFHNYNGGCPTNNNTAEGNPIGVVLSFVQGIAPFYANFSSAFTKMLEYQYTSTLNFPVSSSSSSSSTGTGTTTSSTTTGTHSSSSSTGNGAAPRAMMAPFSSFVLGALCFLAFVIFM